MSLQDGQIDNVQPILLTQQYGWSCWRFNQAVKEQQQQHHVYYTNSKQPSRHRSENCAHQLMIKSFFPKSIRQACSMNRQKHVPLIITMTVFLLFANLVSMTPYNPTATGHLAVTFGFSVS